MSNQDMNEDLPVLSSEADATISVEDLDEVMLLAQADDGSLPQQPVKTPKKSKSTRKSLAKKRRSSSSNNNITDPDRLTRRPLTAYNLFCQAKRSQIMSNDNSQHAHASAGQAQRQQRGESIGNLWKQLSEDEKRRYQDLANKECERYTKQIATLHQRNIHKHAHAVTPSNSHVKVPPPSVPHVLPMNQTITAVSRLPSFHHIPLVTPPTTTAPTHSLSWIPMPPGMVIQLTSPCKGTTQPSPRQYQLQYHCFSMKQQSANEYIQQFFVARTKNHPTMK
jgi:hypothetical protein